MRRGLICGAPRSGTTALGRILHELPGIISTHEIGVYCKDTAQAKRILSDPSQHEERRVPPIDLTTETRWTTESLLARMEPFAATYLDKLPDYLLNLEEATACCDFVICCLRDPREVILSQIEGWHRHENERSRHPWVRANVAQAQGAARSWLDYMRHWQEWRDTTAIPWVQFHYDRPLDCVVRLAELLETPEDPLREALQEFRPHHCNSGVSPLDLPFDWLKMMHGLGIATIPKHPSD